MHALDSRFIFFSCVVMVVVVVIDISALVFSVVVASSGQS